MMHIFLMHNLTIVNLYISRRRADGRLLRWAVERDGNALVLYFFIPYLHFLIVISSSLFPGDVLTGACFVGLWNVAAMRWFVLAPLLLYLALGSVLLAIGFVSLFR